METLTDMALVSQIIEDFSIVPRVKLEIPKPKNLSDKGTYCIATGMKAQYLGAFTNPEIAFIRKIIRSKNEMLFPNAKVLKIMHTTDSNGLVNKSDIHLFSGSSLLGTFRIDINPKSKATHLISVQKILDILIQNEFKFDMVIFDPPYNARYDKRYSTQKLNKIKNGENSDFLQWLVEKCLKIVNTNGLLISKNWRSIMPKNCKFVGGMISKYGGPRRITLLEVWKYVPDELFETPFDFDCEKGEDTIKWILGDCEGLSKTEKKIITKYTKGKEFTNAVFITRGNKSQLPKLTTRILTPEEYVDSEEIFDLIILDKCTKIGGSKILTPKIKNKIHSDIASSNGMAFMKTYFDPVLEKKEQNPLKRIDQMVITYKNYYKIDMITIYKGGK